MINFTSGTMNAAVFVGITLFFLLTSLDAKAENRFNEAFNAIEASMPTDENGQTEALRIALSYAATQRSLRPSQDVAGAMKAKEVATTRIVTAGLLPVRDVGQAIGLPRPKPEGVETLPQLVWLPKGSSLKGKEVGEIQQLCPPNLGECGMGAFTLDTTGKLWKAYTANSGQVAACLAEGITAQPISETTSETELLPEFAKELGLLRITWSKTGSQENFYKLANNQQEVFRAWQACAAQPVQVVQQAEVKKPWYDRARAWASDFIFTSEETPAKPAQIAKASATVSPAAKQVEQPQQPTVPQLQQKQQELEDVKAADAKAAEAEQAAKAQLAKQQAETAQLAEQLAALKKAKQKEANVAKQKELQAQIDALAAQQQTKLKSIEATKVLLAAQEKVKAQLLAEIAALKSGKPLTANACNTQCQPKAEVVKKPSKPKVAKKKAKPVKARKKVVKPKVNKAYTAPFANPPRVQVKKKPVRVAQKTSKKGCACDIIAITTESETTKYHFGKK